MLLRVRNIKRLCRRNFLLAQPLFRLTHNQFFSACLMADSFSRMAEIAFEVRLPISQCSCFAPFRISGRSTDGRKVLSINRLCMADTLRFFGAVFCTRMVSDMRCTRGAAVTSTAPSSWDAVGGSAIGGILFSFRSERNPSLAPVFFSASSGRLTSEQAAYSSPAAAHPSESSSRPRSSAKLRMTCES